MSMVPLFSIITVTYNAARTLPRTLQSVGEQTCKLYEHIIIDGKSADSTIDIVRAFPSNRVWCISEPDKGTYDAMNKGISKAKGEYLIFLNAGDKFHSPKTLQRLADVILDNDYPGIVYGQTVLVDDDGIELGPRHLTAPEILSLDSFKNGMVVCHQAMAVLARIAPFYNLEYKYSADYEWGIRCLQHSRCNVYAGTTTIDYLSEGLTTANHRKSLCERFKIMCEYYGTIPTIVRHAKFLTRHLANRRSAANRQ